MGRVNVFIKKFDSIFEDLYQKLDPYRFLSGNTIKIIAIVIMFIDHFSKIILTWIQGNIWFPMYLDKQMSWEQFSQIEVFTLRFISIWNNSFPAILFFIS